MKRFYSKTTQVSYLEGIHKVMPEDAVEISEERFLAVIANPAPDKVRGHDAQGLPILIDPPAQDLAIVARAWRDAEIIRVQWIRDRHRDELELDRVTTITADQYAELIAYMQKLRDWPESPGFPADDSRPDVPGWVFAQTQ